LKKQALLFSVLPMFVSACSGGSSKEFEPECGASSSCAAPSMSSEVFSGVWRSECGAFTVDFPSFAYGQISYKIQGDQVSRTVWEYSDSACTVLTDGFEIRPTLNGVFSVVQGVTATNIGDASQVDIQWSTFTALNINAIEVVADDLTGDISKDIWLVQGDQFYFGSIDSNVDDISPTRPLELQSIVLTRVESN